MVESGTQDEDGCANGAALFPGPSPKREGSQRQSHCAPSWASLENPLLARGGWPSASEAGRERLLDPLQDDDGDFAGGFLPILAKIRHLFGVLGIEALVLVALGGDSAGLEALRA